MIDSFVYHNIADWHWLREGEQSSNQPIGTYEKGFMIHALFGALI